MTDIEKALVALDGHTLALCKDGDLLTADERGIAPMMRLIENGADLVGYSAADLVVGKAAALLFVYAGIVRVHARVLSEGAVRVLEKYGVPYTYDRRAAYIVNRRGDGMCPMECAVADTDEPNEALALLTVRLAELSGR